MLTPLQAALSNKPLNQAQRNALDAALRQLAQAPKLGQ